MKSVDPGVLDLSVCFAFTPCETAKNLMYYITWCGHYYCNSRYYVKRPFFPPILVLLVEHGSLHVTYRGEDRVAREGDLVLLDCTEPHYYGAEDGLEFYYIHFDGVNSHDLIRYVIDQHGWIIHRRSNKLLRDSIRDTVKFYEDGGMETPMQTSLRVYQMLEILMAADSEDDTADSLIRQTAVYIRNHVGEPMTLADLAGKANLSVYYFSHRFKELTGVSPIDYVINSRIERAKVLLVRTSKSVEEIAEEVGYTSGRSLINLFSKREGISPTQYRKQYHVMREM